MAVWAKGAQILAMTTAIFSEPVRKLRSTPAAQLVLLLVLLLLVGLILARSGPLIAQIEGERGITPVASSEDIQVSGIEVNVHADSAEKAREEGWKVARRKAWKKLGGADLSDSQIDSYVSAIVIEDEKIGPRRYIARLGVVFDRNTASQFISDGGGKLSGPRSAPMLVIPVLYSGGVRQVFEVRGPWQRTWANFQPSNSRINYVRVNGAGGDSLILTAGQPGRRSRAWWRDILNTYNAADVVVPVVRLERQWPGGPVKGRFTARFGPDNTYLDSFTLTASDEENLPKMLEVGLSRIDNIYTKALDSGRLKPDPSLIEEEHSQLEAVFARLRAKYLPQYYGAESGTQGETDAQVSGVEGGGGAAVSTYTVQFATPGAADVDAAMAAVRGAPGVQGAVTTSLAIGGTSVMNVSTAGDLNSLAAYLRGRGWQVTMGSNAIRISR